MGAGRNGGRQAGEQGSIHWLRTLLQGRPRRRADLIRQPRSRQARELWLVIVDASASTRRDNALGEAKGVLGSFFAHAYRQRARLALLTASGGAARWHCQGVKAAHSLKPWLDALGAGGGTPLLEAISEAQRWLAGRQRRHPAELHRVLLLTDGRLKPIVAQQPFACPALLVDIEVGAIRLGRSRQLAHELGAHYWHVTALPSG